MMQNFVVSCIYRLLIGLAALVGAYPVARAADQCPAVACDCQSLPQDDWKKECSLAEQGLKKNCSANNNEPKGFCSLHGPSAKPLPLATQFVEFKIESSAAALVLLEQQLATAQWSLHEDLASLQKSYEHDNMRNFSPLLKMLNTHADAAFMLERQVVAGWQANQQSSKANAIAANFTKALKSITEDCLKLSEKVWRDTGNFNDEEKRYQQTLVQRLLRITGKFYEHQAFAFADTGDTASAAKSWQDAARLDEHQVRLEAAGTNKAEYISFYSLQASARWNRASYYWVSAKNTSKAQEAWRQAEQLEMQFSDAQ